jgi:hypothetical protein
MVYIRCAAFLILLSGLLQAETGIQLPTAFEPNLGQTNGRFHFVARAPGYTMLISPGGAVVLTRKTWGQTPASTRPKTGALGRVYQSPDAATSINIVGAAAAALPEPFDRQPGISAYFIGNDPSRWLPEVPHYAGVRYRSIYRGIDLLYYANGGEIEYDFVVAPGGDPGRIRLAYEGAGNPRVDEAGDLIISTGMGDLRQRRPRVYQEKGGRQVEVATAYRLNGRQVRFEVGRYDRRLPLVIDPVLVFSTYFGPNAVIHDMAVDKTGATYVTGYTSSVAFPVANALQATANPGVGLFDDAFVAKVSHDSTGKVTLVYSTYFGGSGYDNGNGIAVDSSGAAYISGTTNSLDFPILNAYQSTIPSGTGGSTSGFVAKINPYSGTGKINMAYSTYLGGHYQQLERIAVDNTGAAYVVGIALSSDFPYVNGFHPFGSGDPFIVRLNPYNGTGNVTVAYSTSLGGNGRATAVAVDSTGAAYVAGYTFNNSSLVTANAFQATAPGGFDAFVAKVNPFTGGPVTLAYSTYLGGSGTEYGNAIVVDSFGGAYVTGSTTSTDFPVLNALQSHNAGNSDVFVTKLNPYSGTGPVTLGFSTYFGGAASDGGNGIALDSSGSVYITGSTQSANYPVLDTAPAELKGSLDVLITKLNVPASGPVTLAYSTLLGGQAADIGAQIAIDPANAIQVAGTTSSPDFPLLNAIQPTYIDVMTDALLDSDGFIAALPQPGTVVKTPLSFTVTSPTLSSLPSGQSIVVGQPMSFTAAITGAGGPAPTGTVSFIGSSAGTVLCSAALTASGASCSAPATAELAPGPNSITVGYPGDATYTLGTVTPLTFSIAKATTSTTVTVPVSTPPVLNATVKIVPPGAVFQNQGSVSFARNGVPIPGCTAVSTAGLSICSSQCPVTQLVASCNGAVPVGPASFTATYSGDTSTLPSTSPAVQGTIATNPLSVSPSAGSGSTQLFTFTFAGISALQNPVVNVLINSVLDGRHACYVAFVPGNAGFGGSLFLVDDAGDSAGPYSGLVLPGNGSASNSQCAISAAGSFANTSGGGLTLGLAITFTAAFAGDKVVYLAAHDATSTTGWLPLGTWSVAGGTPMGPSVSGMSPARSTGGASQVYTFNFADTNGWEDLAVVNVLVASSINGIGACYVAFVPSANGAGAALLVDDAGDANGPFSGILLPDSGTVSNKQCSISAVGSSVSASGNNLTLKLAMSFSPGQGNLVFYLAAQSPTQTSGWQAAGSITVP